MQSIFLISLLFYTTNFLILFQPLRFSKSTANTCHKYLYYFPTLLNHDYHLLHYRGGWSSDYELTLKGLGGGGPRFKSYNGKRLGNNSMPSTHSH